MNRELLYDRINKRVDIMLDEGLLKEVESLMESKAYINAIGYNEIFKYFEGLSTLEDAIELVKRNSRRYAKRQFTWFSNQMDTNWIDVDNLSKKEIIENALKCILKIGFIS
jgi:tRNA dimethylallyltransferase